MAAQVAQYTLAVPEAVRPLEALYSLVAPEVLYSLVAPEVQYTLVAPEVQYTLAVLAV